MLIFLHICMYTYIFTCTYIFMYIFMNMCMNYIHIYSTTINLKEAMNLKKSKERYMESFGGMKGKDKRMFLY